jgi:hypothetical protein
MKTAYVGFMTNVQQNWRSFCPAPVPPANYKDPVKIQEWMDRTTEKQVKEAEDKPLTGRISEFCLLERHGEEVVDKGNMSWPDTSALEIISLYDRIFVLNVGIFSVLARMEHLDMRGTISPEYNWIITSRLTHVPLIFNTPQSAPRLFDPIDLLVSSTAEENRNSELVMIRLTGRPDDSHKGRTAAERAKLALMVAQKLGV